MVGILALVAQALLYFSSMAALFRLRHRLGIGVFVCALGVMHFLETYLAAVFFIRLPFGSISPGSTVMFAGKLAMILMLYIREDAETARQPIYGLFIGNLLTVALAAAMRLYSPEYLAGHNADLSFLNQLGALMVLGTTLLFFDSLGLILLYERLGHWLGGRPFVRASVALIVVLSFDQLLFYEGLHLISGAPANALVGGWVAKAGAGLVYGLLITGYLRWVEPITADHSNEHGLSDLFGKLTYRHRYETLLKKSGIDAMTGLSDRGRFDDVAGASMKRAIAERRPLSLVLLDVDHFKMINDRYGHVAGDDVLRRIAQALRGSIRPVDQVFRYGGEEFVVLCEGLTHKAAMAQAERLRQAVPAALHDILADSPTISLGVATTPADGSNILELVLCADRHLYAAKREGRDRVVGADRPEPVSPGFWA
jgi:diguanylate cyclase (GGDEF)-like protein